MEKITIEHSRQKAGFVSLKYGIVTIRRKIGISTDKTGGKPVFATHQILGLFTEIFIQGDEPGKIKRIYVPLPNCPFCGKLISKPRKKGNRYLKLFLGLFSRSGKNNNRIHEKSAQELPKAMEAKKDGNDCNC